jgi:predicted nucleic acid-binding protein
MAMKKENPITFKDKSKIKSDRIPNLNSLEFNPIIYDACVLYPATLRDLLVELAVSRLFLAHWTNTIHDEWIRNLLKNRTDLNVAKLERTRKQMNDAVPGSLVTGFEPIIPTLTLPDPNDRHVLAAAIHTNARGIVTFNLKDFPAAKLEPYNLQAIHPDEFVLHWLKVHPNRVAQAIRNTRNRLRNPARTVDEHLERLNSQGLLKTVAMLATYRDLI